MTGQDKKSLLSNAIVGIGVFSMLITCYRYNKANAHLSSELEKEWQVIEKQQVLIEQLKKTEGLANKLADAAYDKYLEIDESLQNCVQSYQNLQNKCIKRK